MLMFNFALFVWMMIAVGMIAIGSAELELGSIKKNKLPGRFFLGTGFLILFVTTIIAGVVSC